MKKFDAVKMVREIRGRLCEQTKKMTRVQLLEFYRSKSRQKQVHSGPCVKAVVG